MKGAIFIALNDMIEQNYGIGLWEDLIKEVNPPSKGVYTSTQDYHEREIVDFIIAIGNKLNLSITEVQKVFGSYLFGELNKKYPIFTQLNSDLFPFLHSINGVIHREVEKLYTEPNLPTIECEQIGHDLMEMRYRSPRKMCYLAEGLTLGAACHFGREIEMEHVQCMHHGAECCIINIRSID